MKRLIKKFRTFGLLTLIAGGALTMAGCSNAEKEAKSSLNDNIKEKINEVMDSEMKLSFEIDKYEFLGADFNKNGNVYHIELSGIASDADKSKNAYVTAGLNVDNERVSQIKDKSSLLEMMSFLSEVVKEYDFEYLSEMPVNNIKQLNNAITKSLESPVKDYKNNGGMLYNLSKPEIDREEGYAVFQTKTYMNYKKTETTTSFGVVGFDKDGKPRYGMVTSTKTYYEAFIQTNNIYVRANDQQLTDIENNAELAYTMFVDAVNNKEKNNYIIQSVEVEKAQEFNTNMKKVASMDLGK